MEVAKFPSVSLYNVAETVSAEWADDGDRFCRVPTVVSDGLNDMARDRVGHPTGSEVRFVLHTDDAEVEVTLSASEPAEIHMFWGSSSRGSRPKSAPTPRR
jgi:hypothetical protein